jgi:hypothetical protein
MPETYAALRARYALGANPYDPRDSILASAPYLHEMHDRCVAPGFLAAFVCMRNICAPVDRCLARLSYVATLAPIVGGGQTDDRKVVVADVGTWLQPLLFPVQAGGKQVDYRLPFAVQPERQPTVRPTVDLSGLAPQSNNLSVCPTAKVQPQ